MKREPGVEVIDAAPDALKDDQVRITMKVASICGSDLGFYDFAPSYQKFAKVPVIMGHEFAGEISELGREVTGFKVGDRVCCESVIYCGECWACRSGMTNICENFKVFGMHVNGGFSESVAVDSRFLHRIPDVLGFLEAGVVEPLSVVVNALTSVARQGQWRNAAVIGPGPLGLLAGEVLRSRGISDVLVVGVTPDAIRLEIAKKLGHEVVNSQDSDVLRTTQGLTAGRGFDIIVVAAGAPAALRTALAMTSKGGQIIVLGIFQEEVPLAISDSVRRQISIVGSYGSAWPHYEQAIQLMAEGHVRASKIVTHSFSLEQANEAFETSKSKQGCKVEFRA